MEPNIRVLKDRFGMSDEDIKKYVIVIKPKLSGRVREEEKKKFLKLCKKKNNNQSKQIRLLIDSQKDIDWDKVKILKGETFRKMKTASILVRVSDKIEKEITELCAKNNVTISSYVRYLVVTFIEENEEIK